MSSEKETKETKTTFQEFTSDSTLEKKSNGLTVQIVVPVNSQQDPFF